MKLSDFVINHIASLGIRHVFMLPGGGAMHLNDSLARSKSIEFVCNLHEQASAIAAEAYGQYNKLGVAIVTTGPGGTNTITGVAGAWLESTPMLVISGQVKRADLVGSRGVRQIGFQEINIVDVVKPITKFAVTVKEPDQIRLILEKAVWLATNGRKGPVWIDIPLDVQAAEVDVASLLGYKPQETSLDMQPIIAAAEKTIALLRKSRRPVILVGNGVRHADAVDLLKRWTRDANIPVLCTWKALDFFSEDDPLYIGRPGAVGQRAANFAQQGCDLFISIGARLDFGQTAYSHATFAPNAAHVIVDIDPAEIGKLQMPIEVSISSDAGIFLTALCNASPDTYPDWSEWLKQCRELTRRYPLVLPEFRRTEFGVNNYHFVDLLGRQLADGDVLVPGSSGACSEITCQALPVVAGIRFINTQGLGSMGFGVPAALGVCLAAGGRRTICVDGDGGFIMNSQELALVSRMNLPIKFFVLNNGGYGSIRATQINYFQRHFIACDEGSGLYLPELKRVASCYRLPHFVIDSHDGLSQKIADILGTPGPSICEVIMAPNQVTQPKVSTRQLPDGTMQTMPMEDLWPFLDRKEFHEVMAQFQSLLR